MDRNTEPLSENVFKLKQERQRFGAAIIVLVLGIGSVAASTIDAHRTELAVKRLELERVTAESDKAKHDAEAARANEAVAMWQYMTRQPPPAEKKP